nr:transposase family protein [Planosporangium mesophilum]
MRVRTEQVPWARPGARHTRDFEDVAGWLAQRMGKTSVAKLLRCTWEAVDHIVSRGVAEHIDDSPGCGASGNSKSSCVTCTGSSTRPTPPTTSERGAPPRYAAASPPTKPWSGASANTSTPSSPPSSSACPTPGWKASTPRSG